MDEGSSLPLSATVTTTFAVPSLTSAPLYCLVASPFTVTFVAVDKHDCPSTVIFV